MAGCQTFTRQYEGGSGGGGAVIPQRNARLVNGGPKGGKRFSSVACMHAKQGTSGTDRVQNLRADDPAAVGSSNEDDVPAGAPSWM